MRMRLPRKFDGYVRLRVALKDFRGWLVFSLYVGGAVLELPQDCKWMRLLLAAATFLNAC
jgi:hypothetical protein